MNRLERMADFTTSTDWVQLQQIAEFLRSRNLKDGELLCEGNTTHPLYLMLNLRPATRYMHVGTIRYYFPARRDALDRELRASGCRYIVSDCRVWGLTIEQGNEEIKDDPLALPPDFPEWERELFPWNVKVTHRVGRYYVHQID